MDWHKATSTVIDKKKILKLFKEEGLTIKQLKERFNTTAYCIKEIIKKAGFAVGPDKDKKR